MDAQNTLDCELPGLGSTLGPWRLLERYDAGSFGIVFRVERAGDPEAGPFALKVAKRVEDPRFPREVALLQSLRHASAPRFEDQGWYTAPSGRLYPYAVMQWVEGERLYRWGRGRTSRQVLRVLEQLASVLAAAHAKGAVHRDVKGDNVVVSHEGRAVLLDWGAGWHPGAEPVTDSVLPLGTARYRMPEAVRWSWAHRMEGSCYEAGPADDVYALGVTGYRLCTGHYPPLLEEDSGPPLRLLAPRELATVSTGLERLLWACLREDRDARPTAEVLAAAFKAAAAEPDATHRIVPTLAAAETGKATLPGPRRRQSLLLWAAASMVGGLVVLAGGLSTRSAFIEFMQRDEALVRDTRNVGVGEKALNEVLVMPRVAVPGYAIGRPMPKEPYPGQRRPPCNPDGQRAINGGCWFGPSATLKPPCGKEAFAYEDGCYMPLFDAPAPPASGQPR